MEIGSSTGRHAGEAVDQAMWPSLKSRASSRTHGRLLHATGSCAPNSKAATGHINPGEVEQGLRNPAGPDNGDLPNLYAAADGTARAEFFTTRVPVSGGEMPALLDEDGSAVIIHESPDDHMTQPIGGAGGRIGCGIVSKM